MESSHSSADRRHGYSQREGNHGIQNSSLHQSRQGVKRSADVAFGDEASDAHREAMETLRHPSFDPTEENGGNEPYGNNMNQENTCSSQRPRLTICGYDLELNLSERICNIDADILCSAGLERCSKRERRRSTSERGQSQISERSLRVNTASVEYDIHRACWEGNMQALRRKFKLANPNYIDFCGCIVRELVSVKKVLVSSRGEDGQEEFWQEEGTPAELAVRKGHFDCANLILAVVLYSWRNLLDGRAGHTSSRTTFDGRQHMIPRLLRRTFPTLSMCLASYNEKISKSETQRLHALVAACLLGHSHVVKVILQNVNPDYWETLDKNIGVSRSHSSACAYSAVQAAGLGGDADCLARVLRAFRKNVCDKMLDTAWECLWIFTWPEKLLQFKYCLKVIRNHGHRCKEKISDNHDLYGSIQRDASNWIRNIEKSREHVSRLGMRFVPEAEIRNILENIIDY